MRSLLAVISRQLGIARLLLNTLNLPFMFAKSDAAAAVARQPAILTTIVLAQILLSWLVVWALARGRSAQLAESASRVVTPDRAPATE